MKVIKEVRIAQTSDTEIVGKVTATDGSLIRSEVKHGDAVSLLSSVQQLLGNLDKTSLITWGICLPAIAPHDVVENGLRDKGVWVWKNEHVSGEPQISATCCTVERPCVHCFAGQGKCLGPVTTKPSVESMLAERETRYGSFANHATIAQSLKEQMWVTDNWGKLTPAQRESLEMIQHKVARILNGDPSYADNWVDIAGYAQLVVDSLGGDK